MKIRPVGVEVFHAEGRAEDMAKLIVFFLAILRKCLKTIYNYAQRL